MMQKKEMNDPIIDQEIIKKMKNEFEKIHSVVSIPADKEEKYKKLFLLKESTIKTIDNDSFRLKISKSQFIENLVLIWRDANK